MMKIWVTDLIRVLDRSTLMRTVPLKRTPLIGRRTLIWCLAC